jgi:hypothetical protein
MPMSSKTSSRGSKATPPSDRSSLRCKEGHCPQGQYRTLSGQTPTLTQISYGSLSTVWSLPSKGEATSTTSKGYCLRSNKQPSCEQVSQQHPTHLSCNNHLLTCQVGISRTEGRSTLTSLAAMGHDDQPSGSSMDGGQVASYTNGDTPSDLSIIADLYTPFDT